MKEKIVKYTDLIWVRNLSIWHRVAFFLFPPAVNKQPNDVSDIKDFCISQITHFGDCFSGSTSPSTTFVSNDSPTTSYLTVPETQVSSSHSQLILSDPNTSVSTNNNDNQFFFSNWLNTSSNSFQESINDEVEKYSREAVIMTDDFDLLQWWRKNEKYYPRLCKFAQHVHSIPASSAASERAFSLAGNILTEKRSRLRPKSLDSLLFLNSFFKNFPQNITLNHFYHFIKNKFELNLVSFFISLKCNF